MSSMEATEPPALSLEVPDSSALSPDDIDGIMLSGGGGDGSVEGRVSRVGSSERADANFSGRASPGADERTVVPSVTISEVENDPALVSHFVFVAPDEGTPAAEALAANAAISVSKGDKILHKFRGLKRPKLKSLNVIKQIRKYTKQSTHMSKNIKGKVIDGVHELYTLTAGMMLGMRIAVGHQSKPMEADVLSVEDFTFAEKMNFPARGNNSPPYFTPPHSLVHTFKFKSYAPRVFRRIREFFSIDTASYMMSVCGNYNYLEFISNSKSGQFFFYSHDGKYMIKTQTKDENKFMKRILPHYYKFLTENPNTQLVRILGMHRVKMYHLRRKVHFVIMGSVFDTPQEIHTIYDLKGSLIGRAAKKKERENGGVLKDLDLLNDERKLHLGPEKKTLFMQQLSKDAMFLASLNIMDYSLLVGIHDRTRRTEGGGVGGAGRGPQAASHSNTPFRKAFFEEGGPEGAAEGEEDAADAGAGGGAEAGEGGESAPPSPNPPRERETRDEAQPHSSPVSSSNLRRTSLRRKSAHEAGVQATRRRSSTNVGVDKAAASLTSHSRDSADEGEEDEEEGMDEDDDALDEGDSDDDTPFAGGGASPLSSNSGSNRTTNNSLPGSGSSSKPSPVVPSNLGVGLGLSVHPALTERRDGLGLQGPEGSKRLAKILRPAGPHGPLALGLGLGLGLGTEQTKGEPSALTYGPGQAVVRPWTARYDGGINSRVAKWSPHALGSAPDQAQGLEQTLEQEQEQDRDRDTVCVPAAGGGAGLGAGQVRGQEIYYMGVIDILQQYNLHKRGENLIKVSAFPFPLSSLPLSLFFPLLT